MALAVSWGDAGAPPSRVSAAGSFSRGVSMGLFSGKTGLVLGVVNDYSIAWAIAKKLLEQGAEVGFTHLPGEKMERRVRKVIPAEAKLVTPCDVGKDEDVEAALRQGEGSLRQARLRPPLDRLRPHRRPPVPVPHVQPRRVQDRDGHLRLLARHRRPPRRPADDRRRRDRHPHLLRRRKSRLRLQHDGRLQGGARRLGQVPRLRPRAPKRSASTPFPPGP